MSKISLSIAFIKENQLLEWYEEWMSLLHILHVHVYVTFPLIYVIVDQILMLENWQISHWSRCTIFFFYFRKFRKRNRRDFEENCAEKAGKSYKHHDDVSSDRIGLSLSRCWCWYWHHSEALWWKRQTYAGHFGNGLTWTYNVTHH